MKYTGYVDGESIKFLTAALVLPPPSARDDPSSSPPAHPGIARTCEIDDDDDDDDARPTGAGTHMGPYITTSSSVPLIILRAFDVTSITVDTTRRTRGNRIRGMRIEAWREIAVVKIDGNILPQATAPSFGRRRRRGCDGCTATLVMEGRGSKK
jgi:hypothetical protein